MSEGEHLEKIVIMIFGLLKLLIRWDHFDFQWVGEAEFYMVRARTWEKFPLKRQMTIISTVWLGEASAFIPLGDGSDSEVKPLGAASSQRVICAPHGAFFACPHALPLSPTLPSPQSGFDGPPVSTHSTLSFLSILQHIYV